MINSGKQEQEEMAEPARFRPKRHRAHIFPEKRTSGSIPYAGIHGQESGEGLRTPYCFSLNTVPAPNI